MNPGAQQDIEIAIAVEIGDLKRIVRLRAREKELLELLWRRS